MNSSLEIKMAGESDIGTVWRIVNIAFDEYRHSPVPSSALLETEEHVRQALNNGREHAIICYYGGQPAGTARFYLENGLYFRRLGVLPEFRGKGVTRAMIQWLEDYALTHGEKRIWCNTRSSVERNMSMYRNLGFSLIEDRIIERQGLKVGVATFSKDLSSG